MFINSKSSEQQDIWSTVIWHFAARFEKIRIIQKNSPKMWLVGHDRHDIHEFIKPNFKIIHPGLPEISQF